MKSKPSDYITGKRYLKREHIEDGGNVHEITDIDEVDKGDVVGKHDWRIRLELDGHFWFELYAGNLDRVIEICGDDFDNWYGKKLGFVISEFTAKDGSEKTYIEVVAAPEVILKRPQSTKAKLQPAPKPEKLDPIPFD
jgi:hypothetical protein